MQHMLRRFKTPGSQEWHGVAPGYNFLWYNDFIRFQRTNSQMWGCAACYVDLDVEKTSTTPSLHVDLPGARVDLGMANISFEARQ